MAHNFATTPSYKFYSKICIVHNPAFGAAGYCYNETEYQQWKYPDGRRKTWLQYEHAQKLAK